MTTHTAKKIVLKDADGSYLIPYTTPYKGGDAITVKGNEISVNREELYCYNKAEIDQMLSKNVSLPVGTEIAVYCTEKYVPTGCVPEDGAEYTKEQFPDLWNDYLGRSSGPRVTWGDEHIINSTRVKYGIRHLVYGNNKFVATASGGYIATSEDGLNWSSFKKVPGVGSVDGLSFIRGRFMLTGVTDLCDYNTSGKLVNNYSVVTESLDGMNWSTPVPIHKSYCEFTKVAYGYGKYVAIGGGAASTWEPTNASGTMESSYIATSTNGTTWGGLKAVLNKTTSEWTDIVYAKNMFVMVGCQWIKPTNDAWDITNGLIATSLDGVTWTQRKINNQDFNVNFKKIIFDGEKFIAFGVSPGQWGKSSGIGVFMTTSFDGVTWTSVKAISNTLKFQDICYVDNKYHIVCKEENVENTPSSKTLVILESYDLGEWVQSSILLNNYKTSASHVNITTDGSDAIISLGEGRLYHMVKSTPQETKLLPTCSYEEYAEYMTIFGQCAKFAIDIERGTFKVPFKKNGAVTQQALTDDELNTEYLSGAPNIAGVGGMGWCSSTSTNVADKVGNKQLTGPFYLIPNPDQKEYYGINDDSCSANDPGVGFDASLCSKVYGRSDNIQMEAVALRHFVVLANGQINQSMMDWAAWASSLQAKMNADHSNDTAPYILNIVMEGTEGYIIYSNGFCEQWGKVILNGLKNDIDVGLHYPYRDRDYFIEIQVCHTTYSLNQATGVVLEDANQSFKTTKSFKYGAYGKYTGFYWKTRGFINL